jgi:arylsulfatase A-like enzyme
MLTGQYAHNHGVLWNDYALLRDKESVLPVWLRRAGYRTAHVGKWLNHAESADGRTRAAPGWDRWFTSVAPRRYYDYDLEVDGTVKHFGAGRRAYLTRVLNREAIGAVRRFAPQDRPFYLQLDHYAPHQEDGHSAGVCSGGPLPEPQDYRRFADAPLPRPPSFNEHSLSDKPRSARRERLTRPQIARRELLYRCGLASLRTVDRGIGRLFRSLRQEEVLGETVILFTSDNGYFHGEHRITADKRQPYEEAIHLPLFVRAPPGILGSPPVERVRELVGNIDLAPTILELAGGRPCAAAGECRKMDGRSLVPLMRGDQRGWPADRQLVIEYGRCGYRGLRAPDRVLIERFGAHARLPCIRGTQTEYYDLRSDPYQLRNSFPAGSRSRLRRSQRSMRRELDRLWNCAGIEGRDDRSQGRPYCR